MKCFDNFLIFENKEDFNKNTELETSFYSEAMNRRLYNRQFYTFHSITIEKPASYPAFFQYNGVEYVECHKQEIMRHYEGIIKNAQEKLDKLSDL